MPIDLDGFDQPNDERDPTDFKRTKAGTPQVKSLTKTRKRPGKKADLLAAAEAAGHAIPVKITVAELHDLLGSDAAWETYKRPSGYGDLISEKYQLEHWKQRCVALGIAIDPQMLAVMADVDPNDPDAEKKALDRIVTKAHEAADSDLAARRGTWVHELTEWADEQDTITDLNGAPWRDPKFEITDDQALAIASGWRKLVTDNALDFQASEVRLVNDELRMAGSADRVALVNATIWFGDEMIRPGTVVIVDIKTSKLYADANGVPAFWHSYAIQLYAYASSVPYITETDTRGEWPFEVDQTVGLIAHLDMDRLTDDGEAVWQLIRVDLNVGRQGVEAVQAAEAYAAAPKFVMPDEVTVVTVGESPAGEPALVPEPVDRREVLHARYAALCEADQARFVALGVDMGDLDAVEAALDSVDPFAQHSEPVTHQPVEVASVERLTPAADTSGNVTDADIAALELHYRALEPACREWIGHLARAAQQAGAGLNLHEKPSRRRFKMMSGLVDYADIYGPDAGDIFVAVLGYVYEYVHGQPIPANANHGEVIASFDADRAAMFANTVRDLIDGVVHAIYGDDGRCTITRQPAA